MDAPIAASRHQRGAPATLAVTWTDQYGEAAAASGAVTVRVQTADGTDVISAGSSTVTGTTGVYTRALTAAQTASLQFLTATWTDAGTGATRITLHEIVGAFYFSLAYAEGWDPSFATHPAVVLRARRDEVEAECELITKRAWTPHYRRIVTNGTEDTTLTLPDAPIRTVRTARIYSSATAYTSFTAPQLAALAARDDGTLVRTDDDVFDLGDQNIVLEYEHGFDSPPPDLLDAILTRFKDRISRQGSGIQQRTTTWNPPEGGTVTFAQPGLYSTGLPEVDAVYRRHSRRNTQIAGRVFDFDPTRGSIFHGWRR